MAATDVVDLTWAKEALGETLGSPLAHQRLANVITAASDRLDRACGPVVQRTITDELHTGGCEYIRLYLEPVASITTLTEYDSAGSPTVLTLEDYDTDGTYGLDPFRVPDPAGLFSSKVWRRNGSGSGTWFARGRRNVKATYVAGRYATTVEAQASRFGEACMLLVRWLWGQQQQQVAEVGEYDVPVSSYPRSMPMSVRQLLAQDWAEGVVVA